MHHVSVWLLLACALLVCVGCAPMRVAAFAPRGVDLSSYRTFDWGSRESFITGDARLDENSFFQDHLKAQVERRLAEHGVTRAATPDLIAHYHASVSQSLDFAGLDPLTGACSTTECGPVVHEAGTLVLDLVERGTDRLIWRGWADGPLAGAIENQRWMEAHVEDAVAKIVERFSRDRRASRP